MLRLTRAQLREIDRRAIADYHLPGIVLMENAARSASAIAISGWPTLENVLLFCGSGNNGGDGLAIARHLHNAGKSVRIVMVSSREPTGDALINLNIVRAMKLLVEKWDGGSKFDFGGPSTLIVDALLGTGLNAHPKPEMENAIRQMNESSLPILAIDVPSGLDCDTGTSSGECIRATKTVTFVAEKIGFANPQARKYLGEVIAGDIGCPKSLIDDVRRSTS